MQCCCAGAQPQLRQLLQELLAAAGRKARGGLDASLVLTAAVTGAKAAQYKSCHLHQFSFAERRQRPAAAAVGHYPAGGQCRAVVASLATTDWGSECEAQCKCGVCGAAPALVLRRFDKQGSADAAGPVEHSKPPEFWQAALQICKTEQSGTLEMRLQDLARGLDPLASPTQCCSADVCKPRDLFA